MGNATRNAALALSVFAAACGGNGGGTGSGSNFAGASYGAVALLEHWPVDGEVQVPLDAVLTLRFDADMAIETFADEDTWLRVVGSSDDVAVAFSRGSGGRVSCQPQSPLEPETDYELQLSPLTSDQAGRILDITQSFRFRTYDTTPPQVATIDVDDGAQAVSRTRAFALTFSEVIAPTSVAATTMYLRDVFGGRFALDYTFAGNTVTARPFADLPGDRQFTLVATTALSDRAGNRLPQSHQVSFRTAVDTVQPRAVATWPTATTGISPLVQPTIEFDESMDPATVETASLLFQDEFGSVIPFAVDATSDQRRLRVRPTVTLQQNRRYTMAFLLGAAAATDVSGNSLQATAPLQFTTGSDLTAPRITATTPTDGESRVPATATLTVTFDEVLDAAWVGDATFALTVDGDEWPSVVAASGKQVTVTPIETLPTEAACVLRVLGGQDGVHDVAGNVLEGTATIGFTTSADPQNPSAILLPPDGAVGIAPQSRIAVVFDAPMELATVDSSRIQLTDDGLQPVACDFEVSDDGRYVHLDPIGGLAGSTYYRIRIVGGSGGPRRASGNWFETDLEARFRTGTIPDNIAPNVTVTLNGIPSSRNSGLVLPPDGFRIDVQTNDSLGQWSDLGAVEIVLEGGPGPSASRLAQDAIVGYGSYVVTVPSDSPLGAGNWQLSVNVRDLSGNLTTSATLPFAVDNRSSAAMPFERTQVVWVRTDLDRNNNGRGDFADDMMRLGFGTDGDPLGTNAFLHKVVLDGILAKANDLYRRGDRGQPIGPDSVALRFSTRQPIALPHMQIALGGLDPEGSQARTYGADSTGTLGRAYYDYRNGNLSERNIVNSPGLGVFPAEMWLYQTHIHLQVYPSYLTLFAQRFKPICPPMGGTPAGSHALDAIVLSPDFDYANATTAQRARWQTIMDAADDWAAVIGVILAHEVGHSVGLVAPGAMPKGLFGDSSLHDTYAGAAEVMAPSVGYEAMTSLDYGFRDIDLAYLQQRILLR